MLRHLTYMILVHCALGVWADEGVPLETGSDGCLFHTKSDGMPKRKMFARTYNGEVGDEYSLNVRAPEGSQLLPHPITMVLIHTFPCLKPANSTNRMKASLLDGGNGKRFALIKFRMPPKTSYKIYVELYRKEM